MRGRAFEEVVRPESRPQLGTGKPGPAHPRQHQPHAAGHSASPSFVPRLQTGVPRPPPRPPVPARNRPALEFQVWGRQGDQLGTFVPLCQLLVFYYQKSKPKRLEILMRPPSRRNYSEAAKFQSWGPGAGRRMRPPTCWTELSHPERWVRDEKVAIFALGPGRGASTLGEQTRLRGAPRALSGFLQNCGGIPSPRPAAAAAAAADPGAERGVSARRRCGALRSGRTRGSSASAQVPGWSS